MNQIGFIKDNHTPKSVVEDATVIIPKDDFRHALFCGQTGSGKTIIGMNSNVNHKIMSGHSIMLFDHKGVESRNVKYFSKKHNRLDDVIELGVPWGISCNLIQHFNDKTLILFVKSLMSMSKENDYWSQTAGNICSAINKSLKSIRDINNAAAELNNRKSFENLTRRFKLPLTLTFSDIAGIMQSVNKVATFLNKLQKISVRFIKMTEMKIQNHYEKYGKEASESKYLELMTKVLSFDNLVKTELSALEVFKDVAEDSGGRSSSYQTLFLSIIPPFASIADNKNFNDPKGTDIVEALNNGKILVINSQELQNTVLSNLTSSVLLELSKRVNSTNIQPVSIFIDEAQRVMDPQTDIQLDVIRQSKISVIMAFPNISLMQEALGKTAFLALVQNLSTSFHFKNALDFSDLETSKLETFQYYKNGIDKVHTAVPVFLDKDEVFDAEVEYFNLHGIYHQLNIDKKDRNKVIQFNPSLYQKGLINLVSKDKSVKTIKLRNIHKELETISVIHKVIKDHEATLKHKREAEPEYETLTAAMRANRKNLNDFMTPPESKNA